MSLEAWGDENPDNADFESWADRARDAGWFDPEDYSPGAVAILQERDRQEAVEQFSPLEDDAYVNGELLSAAVSYTYESLSMIWAPNGVGDCPVQGWAPEQWPWDPDWWKPSADPIRNLEKAGALIAAEIDRLQRAEKAKARAPEQP